VITDESIPEAFALRENRPNPFSSTTSVALELPVGCAVSLKVFDAQGSQVRALVDQAYPAGPHCVGWGGGDERGNAVGSGIYFVRMEAGDFKATSKMLLTR
jgi:flagellar hook assembly protein FlgD